MASFIKADVSEMLLECPKGTPLYSPIFGDCELTWICEESSIHTISVTDSAGKLWYFTKEGVYEIGGEVLLFPSRLVRNWGLFKTKFIIGTSDPGINKSLLIKLGGSGNEVLKEGAVAYWDRFLKVPVIVPTKSREYRYLMSDCTRLFPHDASEFKEGDVIVTSNDSSGGCCFCLSQTLEHPQHEVKADEISQFTYLRLATPQEIKDWNQQVLGPIGWMYSQDLRKIISIPEFKAYDRVLVKNSKEEPWIPDFFGFKNKSGEYRCIGGTFKYCIPYSEDLTSDINLNTPKS